MQRAGNNVTLCNGLLQAAGRLHHQHTNIDGGCGRLYITGEPTASTAITYLNPILPPELQPVQDAPLMAEVHLHLLATAVWSMYTEAAAAGTAFTEAAWQAVWDWQATPGDTTQQRTSRHRERCAQCCFCSCKQLITLSGLHAMLNGTIRFKPTRNAMLWSLFPPQHLPFTDACLHVVFHAPWQRAETVQAALHPIAKS